MTKEPTIKILVGYHKPAVLLKSDVLVPIHLGRALATEASKDGQMSKADYQWMLDNMIGDDTGDNISNLNREFCELTGIYWAWKNYDKLGNPDFIGFMHYRRVFDFNKKADSTIANTEQLPDNFKQSFKDDILNALKKYNLIIPYPEDIAQYKHTSIYDHYTHYSIHYPSGLYILKEIVKEKYPELEEDFEKYFGNTKAYFTNMFIMEKSCFFKYCEILFKILFDFREKIDLSNASIMNRRACAYIGEYFTGLYLYHIKNKERFVETARVLIINTDLPVSYTPAFKKKNIPIVFSADDNYAIYLNVCLSSLLKNASPEYNYDILIIDGKISEYHKKQLSTLSSENVSIRYVDISPYMTKYNQNIFYLCSTHTISTYYRFFLPELLNNYKKVLYIDPDTVILKDIVKLYKVNLKNHLIGAIKDIGLQCELQMPQKNIKQFLLNTLEIKEPYDYFQGGVMLLNIEKLQQFNFTKKCIDCLIKVKTPRFVDQDIMNSVCYGQVEFIANEWNVEWQLPFSIPLYERFLPKETYLQYLKARNNPAIIHYSGPKPWNILDKEFSDVFWLYARDTRCYEEILSKSNKQVLREFNTYIVQYIKKTIEERVQSLMLLFNSDKNSNKIDAPKFNYMQLKKYSKLYMYKILSSVTFGKLKASFKKKKNKQKHKLGIDNK